MSIKRGDVVSHSAAIGWGVGKVVEVTSIRMTIQFNDGITRKIACSHYASLLPAEANLFVPVPQADLKVATKPAPKGPKKTKAATSKPA